jgi:signal transduction histidine kinase
LGDKNIGKYFTKHEISELSKTQNKATLEKIYHIAKKLKNEGNYQEAIQVTELIPLKTIISDSLRRPIGNALIIQGIAYKNLGEFQEALLSNSNAKMHFQKIEDCEGLVKSYNNSANIYNQRSHFNQAISFYKKALELVKKCPNSKQEAILEKNLAGIHFNYHHDISKAITGFQVAEKKFNNTNNNQTHLLSVYQELAKLFIYKNNFKKAENYLTLIGNTSSDYKSNEFYFQQKRLMALLYAKNGKSKMAYKAYRELFQNLNQNKEYKQETTSIYIEYLNFLLKENHFENWITVYRNTIVDAQKSGNLLAELQARSLHTQYLEKHDQYQKASTEYKVINEINKQLFNKRNIEIYQGHQYEINSLLKEAEYKMDILEQEKKLESSLKNEEKLKNNLLLISLLAIISIAILLSVLFKKSLNKKKNELKWLSLKAKNTELELALNQAEREEEYKIINSNIEAKKEEQRRISRDLHDHIGANLAAIKLSLNDQKDQHLQELLSEAYHQVKDLSYSLTILGESQNTFEEVLTTYLENIEKSTGLDFDLEILPDCNLKNLNYLQQRELFGIFRELIQNTIKHANAHKIEIVFSSEENILNITFEDDGIGFNPSQAYLGIGLKNMKKRVEILKGSIEFDCMKGRSSIIHLTIPSA